jgi:hypothetical protein
MRRDDRQVSKLWFGVVEWRVLLDGKMKHFILSGRRRSSKATDM